MMKWCLALLISFAGASIAVAQGLSGPSSVVAELEPGDGLTDPQYRSDFPRNVAPGWFAWKDKLGENGFRFSIDYLALGQTTDADLGEGEAASGIARFFGSWQATDLGSLTFKIEDRHSYTDVAPQFLGLDGGALSITGTAFNDNGLLLTNLFWTQRAGDGSWTLQIGQIDVTDFVDVYGLVSPYSGFQNLSFNTSPTIDTPNQGIGIAGGLKLSSNFYAVASLADADADPSNPDFDVFSDGNLFKSIEIGYTSGFDRIYLDNVHLTLWHADGSEDQGREEDYGAAFSAAWFVGNQWMPFFRAGAAKGTAALYDRSVSTGIGYYGRNTDLAGLGLNWAEARGFDGDQFTFEAFYRFSISPGLQITPSVQFISDPLLNPDQDNITLFGLRTRIVF
ncbi:carbohydrate porin [Ruegeria arenilitoris]|uniref:carbohydrate porin n=1 Tax=Ruegeria arenilitoris TaxID=1173585 RepID=UPI001480DA29|nr:carbohydrate porin [Ruegeria arenilitoris]